MFAKFIISRHIGDKVQFETKYYKGIGEIRVLSDGQPGITTEKFVFTNDEIKKFKVIK